MFDLSKSVLDQVIDDNLSSRGIHLFVKRDDLIHSEVSGNKWRKLKYNVQQCQTNKKEGILTFGGAFSNHLLATASACHDFGLKSVGIVRGNELNAQSNHTLRRCSELEMELKFISREEYRMIPDKSYLADLAHEFPNFHIVPEGGANYYGMIGCQEILKEIEVDFDAVFVAQGTTTTSCGLLMGLKEEQELFAVPVLKGFDSEREMHTIFEYSGIEKEWLEDTFDKLKVLDKYHFGGYGKYDDDLLSFIRSFYLKHEIKLDPIYTGKAMFALMKELEDEKWNGKSIVFIHTGGIQGVPSVEEKSGVKLFD
jgi:1-aminocyclopropane-1-carboxylate deaminase